MKRLMVMFGIFVFIMCGSIIAHRGGSLNGSMQIAQDEPEGEVVADELPAEGSSASESCAQVSLGSITTTGGAETDEGDGNLDQQELDEQLAADQEMYNSMQNSGSGEGEVSCETAENGELICNENGKEIHGCKETSDGYVECPR